MPRHCILLIAFITLSRAHAGEAALNATSAASSSELGFLRKHYSPPQGPGESNHFIDLWSGQNLRTLVLGCHLTNNQALFVNSHGMGVSTQRGTQHAYYPHQSLLGPMAKTPRFSAADLAKVLGAPNSDRIHNILLSSCNADGSFSATELRKYFVNATNIVHMPAGKLGYQSMFLQVLTTDSSNVQPLYEICAKNKSGKLEFFLEKTPSSRATQLTPYIAELFRPGAMAPFRTQIAGHETLLLTPPSLLTTKDGARAETQPESRPPSSVRSAEIVGQAPRLPARP